MTLFDSYDRDTLKHLSSGIQVSPILAIERPESGIAALNANRGRISLSGSQSKYSMVIRDGKFTLTEPGEQGSHILKPALQDFENREDSPENEHLTMQIASTVYKIETAANAICFFPNGEPAYITRRFDITKEGTKIPQEDFASLGGISSEQFGRDYKYSALSYEEIGHLIRKYLPSWKVEIVKFFDLILFNFLFSNGDAHLKNFSVLKNKDGDYSLAPAYDLINTRIHLPEDSIFGLKKGLFADGRSFPLGLNHKIFVEFGESLGIPHKVVSKELDRFCADYPGIDDMIDASQLSDPVKEEYREAYHYRLVSFLRA